MLGVAILETSPDGEIGIHVCLRSICRLVCRFKSCSGHHDTVGIVLKNGTWQPSAGKSCSGHHNAIGIVLKNSTWQPSAGKSCSEHQAKRANKKACFFVLVFLVYNKNGYGKETAGIRKIYQK